jgi:hypothetical protein
VEDVKVPKYYRIGRPGRVNCFNMKESEEGRRREIRIE